MYIYIYHFFKKNDFGSPQNLNKRIFSSENIGKFQNTMEWRAFLPCQGVTTTVNTTFLKVDEFIKLQRLHVQFSIWRRRDVYDWSSAHHVNLFHIISRFLCPIYSGWIEVIHQPASSWNKTMCRCFRESEPSKQNIIPSLPHDIMINFIQIGVYYGLLWFTLLVHHQYTINIHQPLLKAVEDASSQRLWLGFTVEVSNGEPVNSRPGAALRWGVFKVVFSYIYLRERERGRYIYNHIYITHIIIYIYIREGSLEVKLPTIWTDEKA